MTVIEAKVHRSSERRARFAFIIAALVVGVVTMIVASATMHPILAALLGVAVGGPSGALAWALFRIWPVIRLVWWWLPEIAFVTAVMYGWVQLAQHTPMWVRFVIVGLVVGVPALVPAIRRRLIALAWCVIVRHRLRVCFAQFIVANQSGSLPLILWARPTPVGERVWIYLRPGLSVADLQGRLEKIAVACHAYSVLVERAGEGNSAYLRFDIKRREVLTANVGTPLVDVVDPDTPKVPRQPATMPTALDLPDVADEPALAKAAKSAGNPNGKKPAASSADPSSTDDDINDWI
ncbi:hypothetical protein [Spirilliplanes yamanashiensis]|uniref:Uncharacterized protein n=1 Tax=Spirilliplanes yamanashiensis TaxID=42233 RepID=A0A8J3Y3V7_9ACTN|nr:hypothetical protein [Spirilliplanes yamanashiensis]MDP9819965.1 hypothetical protein [Spirilliplanes yamanashiensis]GIJ01216.1 hypothetical protein Sya03_05680 [Spirilliplanes yamanashiensis]